MASPPKKKRSNRPRSTSVSKRSRSKKTPELTPESAPVTEISQEPVEVQIPEPVASLPEPPVIPIQSAPEPPVIQSAPEPVQQPGPDTHLLPDVAPNIVTGYVRLITIGLSFFLAVYLGLEAFSLFVQFPTKLPISSLLINYGHLSNNGAAIAILGLLFGEVAVVQLWAWRTRRASFAMEDSTGETIQTPIQEPEPAPAPVIAQSPAVVQEMPLAPVTEVARVAIAQEIPMSPVAELAPVAIAQEIPAIPVPEVAPMAIPQVESQPVETHLEVVAPAPEVIQTVISPPEIMKTDNVDIVTPVSESLQGAMY